MRHGGRGRGKTSSDCKNNRAVLAFVDGYDGPLLPVVAKVGGCHAVDPEHTVHQVVVPVAAKLSAEEAAAFLKRAAAEGRCK